MTAEQLLLHLTRAAALSDHMGDMGSSLFYAYELLGLKPPATDDDGDFDLDALEARGARSLYDLPKAEDL